MKIKKMSGIFLLTTMLLGGCSTPGDHSHAYGNWILTVEPTLTASGEATRSCSCGLTEVEIVPALSDTTVWSITSSVPASCQSDGQTTYTSIYGDAIIEIPMVTHIPGDWIIDKEATEFEEGSQHKKCPIGGEVVSEKIPYTLDFPRVFINYQDFYPTAPDATEYSRFADWTWDYLTVPFTFKGTKERPELNFSCYAQMRIQGATSIGGSYLKKNYTIKLYNERDCLTKNKIKVVDSWGKQSKYCLKANWIDVTSARNLVNADLWSDVVESRKTSAVVSKRLHTETLVNNGAVDGFPIMLYFNNEFFGLYTFNIPKDNWLFGMKNDAKQGLLFEDDYQPEATAFKKPIVWDNATMSGTGWETEYAYDETNTQWMADSMNKAIKLVMDTYGIVNKNPYTLSADEKRRLRDKFLGEVNNYLDLDGCIDYMIFLHCIQGFPDNSTKNVLWSTYDGQVWTPNAYDLDTTLGLAFDGEMNVYQGATGEKHEINYGSGGFWTAGDNQWFRSNLAGNHLFEAILLFCAEKAQMRYNELRKGPLSSPNIESKFTSFITGVPDVLYAKDVTNFPTRPSEQISDITGRKNTTDLEQILTYADSLLNFMDGQYNGENLDVNIRYFD